MTPTAALYQFWSSFGITAYPSNRVPEDTAFPFITYEPIIANWWTGAAAASTVTYGTTQNQRQFQTKRQKKSAAGCKGVLRSSAMMESFFCRKTSLGLL